MKICKFPTSYVKYQLPFSGKKAGNNEVSEAVTREKGNMGSKQKVQTHSLGNLFKQET